MGGAKAPLIVAPTGAGKTATLVWWACRAVEEGRRILIIVHKDTILRQFMKTCNAFGLNKGTVQILTFDSVFGEGVDVPYCCGVQWLRKTGSLCNWLQYNGRALRPVWPEGFDQYNSTVEQRLAAIAKSIKPMARIQDFAGNFIEHGHPISAHRWTLSDTKVRGKNTMVMPKYTTCKKCLGVWPGQPNVCPGVLPSGEPCLNDLNIEKDRPARKGPKVVEGVMKEVGVDGDAGRIAELMEQAHKLQQMSEGERRKYLLSMVHRQGAGENTKQLADMFGYKVSGKWTSQTYKRLYKKS